MNPVKQLPIKWLADIATFDLAMFTAVCAHNTMPTFSKNRLRTWEFIFNGKYKMQIYGTEIFW